MLETLPELVCLCQPLRHNQPTKTGQSGGYFGTVWSINGHRKIKLGMAMGYEKVSC